GHARALLSLTADEQRELARQIVARGLTVRQTEAMVRKFQEDKNRGPVATEPGPSADIKRLQNDLSDTLGAGVQIQHNAKGKGKLVISYNNLDELDGILAHIK
ncbi:MAG TPA: chromosome partitioning protein ParB, partial [Cellvibrionaceae bacterium]